MPNKKNGKLFHTVNPFLFIPFFLLCSGIGFLFCENADETGFAAVKKLVEQAFTKKTPEHIISFINAETNKLATDSEKRLAFLVLADYEERCDLFTQAALHYARAADMSAGAEKKTSLLKAAGAAILAGDFDKAQLFLSQAAQFIQNPASVADMKIILYSEWSKLKSVQEDSLEFSSVISSLKKHVTDSAFQTFHPALLLTLWWVENDKKAENTLLKKFPNSIEAGVVRGEVMLSPKTFWYLMPRSVTFTPAEVEKSVPIQNTGVGAVNGITGTSITVFQVGFFKNEDYAKTLLAELIKKGFKASIKPEQRPSGLFYSVFAAADGKGDVLLRLKQEGYEPVPVFE